MYIFYNICFIIILLLSYLFYNRNRELKKIHPPKNIVASAGSRTRVYCLEGNYPNRWTTNAVIYLGIIHY